MVTIYRIQYKNVEDTEVTIDIYDMAQSTDEPGEDVQIINLIPGSTPLIITQGDESKLYGIIGRSAQMQFKSTATQVLNIFSSGADNRFSVRITYGSLTPIFHGFLIMDDNSEPYLPPGQDVTLLAADGLGLLKGVDLVKQDGTKFTGENKIIDYVAACLRQTGNALSIVVINNLYENSHVQRGTVNSSCAFNQTFVDALSFEKDINEPEDCYTVLEKILLSFGMRCSYYKGKWYLVRVDEYRTLLHYSTYNSAGVLGAGTMAASLLKNIGSSTTEAIYFINNTSRVQIRRARRYSEVIYNYEYPKEIICNIDWRRGTFSAPLSGSGYQAFVPECWTLERDVPATTPVGANGYFKKVFDNNYEIESYLVIQQSDINRYIYYRSEKMPVGLKDKFSFGLDVRYTTDLTGGSGHFNIPQAQIRLYGSDGSHWSLHASDGINSSDPGPYWTLSDASWAINNKFVSLEGEAENVDFRDWNGVTIEAAPVPIDGEIEIFLMDNQTSASQEKHFQNLRFTYKPYIDGTYVDFQGEQYKVSQDVNLSAYESEEIFISDSPRKIFKGAMKTFDGTNYNLTTLWNDWLRTNFSSIGLGDERFAKWQAFNRWHQFGTEKTILQADLKGLGSTTEDYADAVNIYHDTVFYDLTRNRKLLPLSIEQDWKTCQWTAVFREVYFIPIEEIFSDTFEFKYIT